MKVLFITLGCKANQYETNAMEQSFLKRGYDKANDSDVPDICVVNTCSVTNIAERKSRQMLRRMKELNKKAIVVACGCYSQVGKDELEKMPEVDIIVGVNDKNNIVEIVEKYIKQSEKIEEVSDVMHEKEFQDFGTTTYTELTRAVVKIQDGCDRFCSYCIIPYARGRVRSRDVDSILKEIEAISKQGIKEVVLTGIHIASYGKDFTDEKVKEYREKYSYKGDYIKFDPKDDLHTGGFRLIELLEQIEKVTDIERIRIGSLEPKLINDEFVKRLANLNKICEHFHLSLQSGCNETLKRMNRRYTVEEFEESTKLLRKYFKDVKLTTDIIVGFPGETDEEFNKTYEFLKKIKFYKMHIFKYSIRKGTVAEKMPNQVDGKLKEERSKILIELSNKNEEEYSQELIGKVVDVLFEERKKEYFEGHTKNYIMVKVKTTENLQNEIKKVKIVRTENLETYGKIIN